MDKYDPEYLRGEARLNQEKTQWVINSHLWFDAGGGIQLCEWCDIQVLPGQGVGAEWPGLCEKNPFVKKLINQTIAETKAASILP